MKAWGLPRNPVSRRRASPATACRMTWMRSRPRRCGRSCARRRRRSRTLRCSSTAAFTRLADGGAAGAPVARHRLRRRGDPRAPQLQHSRWAWTPKSGKVRSVPLVADVAQALCWPRATGRVRQPTTSSCSRTSSARFMDASALRDRYKARSRAREPPSAPLPRSPAHVRDAGGAQGRGAGGPVVDGPCRHPNDDALRPPSRPWRRGEAAGAGVRGGESVGVRAEGRARWLNLPFAATRPKTSPSCRKMSAGRETHHASVPGKRRRHGPKTSPDQGFQTHPPLGPAFGQLAASWASTRVRGVYVADAGRPRGRGVIGRLGRAAPQT